ncbi:MAG: hypothetical protein KKB50_02715 [Planctomycetes bacterium]|nr:hypothetical protein [Planctomycetota bacterium]
MTSAGARGGVLGLLVAGVLLCGCVGLWGLDGTCPCEGDLPEGSGASPVESAGGPCDPGMNGCGPGGILSDLVPECPLGIVCFTEACNHHDVCYGTCGNSRTECDERFYADLCAACAERYPNGGLEAELCAGLAYIYWQAVARLGESFFESAQVDMCACVAAQGTARLSDGWVPAKAPFVDRDDDLLPDNWELAVGCDPSNCADAGLDFDGDGLSNLHEYLHGTDPYAPDSDGDGVPDGRVSTPDRRSP